MKIQLLQDLDESGSALRLDAAAAAPWSRAFGSGAPASLAPPAPPAPSGRSAEAGAAAPDGLPEWLGERLREDAERDAQRERKQAWTRRALIGGGAAALLAVLAAAGWWLMQDSRVDGVLLAVASTGVREAKPMAPPRSPGEAAEAPAEPDADVRSGGLSASIAAATGKAAEPPAPAAAPSIKPPARPDDAGQASARSPPRKHRRHDTNANGAMPSRRREETLMQCRAHGYDERQCNARGCAMTRFGLACRG